jgi:hypothetical protein
MKKIGFIILVLFLVGTCARLTRSIGKSNEVVVISAHQDQDLIIDNLQLYNYVPQKEELFKFIFISDTALANYQKHHAILFYGTLQDEYIDVMLSQDARDATEQDTFTLFRLNNLWADGQMTIILAIRDTAYTNQAIQKFGQLISQNLEEHYYQRVKKNYYITGVSGRMKDRLKRFGLTLDINDAWLIDSTHHSEDFLSVHTHFPDRSIFFYKETKDAAIDGAFAIAKRNSLTEQFYDGDYILEELTIAEPIEFADLKGIRLKGVWQNDSLIAGGPFLTYFLTDGDTLYILDGIVFNPGERKSDHFTKIEIILNSFSLIRS